MCEDAWQAAGLTPVDYGVDPVAQLAALVRQDATLSATVNLSASPFHHAKVADRITVARTAAARLGTPFLLANQVGGNDDLFDGSSIAAWPDGTVVPFVLGRGCVHRRPKRVLPLHMDALQCRGCPSIGARTPGVASGPSRADRDGFEGLVDAVVTGLADYCRKSGLHRIVLGLSGGTIRPSRLRGRGGARSRGRAWPGLAVTSFSRTAVTMRAGRQRLWACASQNPFGRHEPAETSVTPALPRRCGREPASTLAGAAGHGTRQRRSAMAIAAGNKSELAQGYCTLYGDMAGGYAPLGDLLKMDVYAMADVQRARTCAGQGRAGQRPR